MKSYVYTIEDEYSGIPLLIEGELVEYNAIDEPPFVIIQEITYSGGGEHHAKPLSLWCLSDAFIRHCQDRVFQKWCSEVL